MTYAIIRPGGLTNDPASGSAILTEDTSASGSITREDTAALVIKALLHKKADNKTLSAVDPARMPAGKAPVAFQI